jgi:hypothetical protein
MSRFTPSSSLSTARIRRFARHYLEMVIAMSAGMLVIGVPAAGALELAGSSLSELKETAPAVYLLAMGVAMTVPMVAWMRYRDHGWRPTSEMGASMMAPTIAGIVLLEAGVTDFDAAMMIEHVVMFPAMLAVMLARWDEYSASHDYHRSVATPQTGHGRLPSRVRLTESTAKEKGSR